MTAPVGDDLTWLDDLERAHEEWRTDDGLDVATTDGRVWNTLFRRPRWMDADDVHRLVAEHNAVPTLIAELRKRDAALRAVLAECDEVDRRRDHLRTTFGIEPLAGRVHVDAIRSTLTAALSPESVTT